MHRKLTTRRPAIVLLIALLSSAQVLSDNESAEVIVLSTLHQLHAQTEGYSFADLSAIIEQVQPDILAVELTAADLESRREQTTKQEYPLSVYPLLDEHNYEVVALEPAQPLFDELVGLFRQAREDLLQQNPSAAEAFDLYVSSLYELLQESWVSVESVNSSETDILFAAKHRFQNALFGPAEAKVWHEWNQHFLNQILKSAKENSGKRILVLVGAEHGYWLRAHLKESDVILLDTNELLR
jgi:pheromone shutdown protein TraB